MNKDALYMMAIIPTEEVRLAIEALRFEFAEAYRCKAALKPPVHITVYPPYKEYSDHEKEVVDTLHRWSGRQPAFSINLNGFDAFRENGVIFINAEKNEALKELHRGFTTQMTKILQPAIKSKQTFHPHITIGYRDIPTEAFKDALKDYLPRKYKASFPVNHIEFWRHNSRNWETIHSFPLRDDSIIQSSLF